MEQAHTGGVWKCGKDAQIQHTVRARAQGKEPSGWETDSRDPQATLDQYRGFLGHQDCQLQLVGVTGREETEDQDRRPCAVLQVTPGPRQDGEHLCLKS